jgi:hypothetical protein
MIEDVLSWTLTDDRWTLVEAALSKLVEAVDAGDRAEIGRLTTVLMLSGPRRIGRGVNESDQPPRKSASPRVRDLVNRLVDRLGGETVVDREHRERDETA